MTKDQGKLYTLGLFEIQEWKEDFTKLMEGKSDFFDWKASRNTYLDCQLTKELDLAYPTHIREISYDDRSEQTQAILQELIHSNPANKLRFKYLPVDGIKSKLKISSIGNNEEDISSTSHSKNIVALVFTGGYDKLNETLLAIKKWIRINAYQGTENYWIEIVESDPSKKFKDWTLKLKMEVKTKPLN